jgi:hypothetical protein
MYRRAKLPSITRNIASSGPMCKVHGTAPSPWIQHHAGPWQLDDVSEEYIASIFRLDNDPSDKEQRLPIC